MSSSAIGDSRVIATICSSVPSVSTPAHSSSVLVVPTTSVAAIPKTSHGISAGWRSSRRAARGSVVESRSIAGASGRPVGAGGPEGAG